MHIYLAKYSTIIQDYPDSSDYFRFYTFSKNYLKENAVLNFNEQLELALKSFTSSTLIKITYKLTNFLKTNINIPAGLLNTHLCNAYLKENVILFIYNTNLHLTNASYKKKIIEYIIDPKIINKSSLFLLQQPCFKAELDTFLRIRDEDYICKQVEIMIASKNFNFLSYFIPHIGSKRSDICFKIYELLFFYTKGNTINIEFPLKVISIENFIFYFYDFMDEKVILKEVIQKSDIESVRNIVSKYILINTAFKIEKRLLRYIQIEFKELCECLNKEDTEEYADFEYLFDGNYFKAYMDCLEI